MHLLPVIFTLLSTNAIVSPIQQLPNFQLEKQRSFKVPKSIFITPSFEPCDRGYVQHEDGRCLRLIKIEEPLPSFLNRLQKAFAGHEEKKNRLTEQKLTEQPESEEQYQAKASQDSKEKTQETLRKVEGEQKEQKQPYKEDQAKLLRHEEVQPEDQRPESNGTPETLAEWESNSKQEHSEPEDQEACTQVDEQGERYSVQSKELGNMPRYHQYFIQNVTTEEIFYFVTFQEEI